jgi:electron transfer flavoprotein beta subunit
MDIIVCVKRVPETSEATLKVDASGKGLETGTLVFDINEADNYALEESLLLKEKLGGTVTVVTVGPMETEDTLRMCLAKGADGAIRVDPGLGSELDPYAVASLLTAAVKDKPYDLILTGCMGYDLGYTQVGVTLAEMLGIPHAAMVAKVDLKDGRADVHRELEGGLLEALDIQLPAVLTVQTGINEPRYASMLGIKRASSKPLDVQSLSDLNLTDAPERKMFVEELSVPPPRKLAEILEGTPEEAASKLASIIKDKGVL